MVGIMMNNYPFIYNPKKELEPMPLYIEVDKPPQKEDKPKEKSEERGVVIIELW